MREPPDLRDLVGGELPSEELEQLRGVDAMLRRVPAPLGPWQKPITRPRKNANSALHGSSGHAP